MWTGSAMWFYKNNQESRILKKLLMLGGSAAQLVAIRKAKELGYFTVLCDYLPDNPGQYLADRFYLVSTIDKEAVLEVAQSEAVDGVIGYASDPAALTVAYVAEQMKLPGNPYKSVDILCNKDKFRKFLGENGFYTPKAEGYESVDLAMAGLKEFRYPVVVKPVDSSGSRGVDRIDGPEEAEEKLEYAMSFSRAGRIIIEEWVENYGYQIAGDGLSVDGKLVFRCFGNDHFSPEGVNRFVPVAATFPYHMPEPVQDKIHETIQRLLEKLHMKTCTYNFDMRIDNNYNVYLMEVAPRNGGNYIPEVIRYATGTDLAEYAVKAAAGDPFEIPHSMNINGCWAYYAVHSKREGILDKIEILPEAERYIVENHIVKRPGDHIQPFFGANTALGCLIMKFDRSEQMFEMIENADQWIKVRLREEQ